MKILLRRAVGAIDALARSLRKEPALQREAFAISDALRQRLTAIQLLKKKARVANPKPKRVPCLIELFIPKVARDCPGFAVQFDISKSSGIREWRFWMDVWDGKA